MRKLLVALLAFLAVVTPAYAFGPGAILFHAQGASAVHQAAWGNGTTSQFGDGTNASWGS